MSGANPQSYHMEENHTVWAPGNHQQHKSCEYFPAFMVMGCEDTVVQLFMVCCVSRLCIKKWRRGQLLALMTCHYTTSQWAPLSSAPKANVCQFSFKKYSKSSIWVNLLKSDTVLSNHKLICCGHLLQMRSAHRQSKYLSSNQIQTEPTPRSVSLLWLSAQTVAILPLKMVRLLTAALFHLHWQSKRPVLCENYSFYLHNTDCSVSSVLFAVKLLFHGSTNWEWFLTVCLCLFDCRQHGQCCVGVGHAEYEPGGRAWAELGCAVLSVGPPTPPPGAVYRQQQTLPVVRGRLRLRRSPRWR